MFMLKNGQDLDKLAPMLDKIAQCWDYAIMCRHRYGFPLPASESTENYAISAIMSYMGIRVHCCEESFECVQECLRSVGWQPWLFDFIDRYGDLRVKSWYLSLAPAWSEECELL